MSDEQQAKFSGWAKVEALGHQSTTGFVETEAFGQAVLFRVDVPDLPEREYTLERPVYGDDGKLIPAGAVVRKPAIQGYSVLYGAGSIYRITPCTEDVARKQVDRDCARSLQVVSLPPGKALAAAVDSEIDDDQLEPEPSLADDDDQPF